MYRGLSSVRFMWITALTKFWHPLMIDLLKGRKGTIMAVNTDISDLFFNRALGHCEIIEKGQFAGYDDDKLADEAQGFLGSLERLGVDVPEPGELIADFHART